MNEKAVDESIALTRDRMLTYQLLSSLYLIEVSAEVLDQLRQTPSLPSGKLADFIGGLSTQNLEEMRTDAAADYARLFLGMSAQPVAPYESVFTSPEHLLMQDARDEVLAVYRAEGFAYAGEDNLPEDHIGTELEFMALLCQKQIDALEGGNTDEVQRLSEVQKTFVQDHLAVWLPEFCDQVEQRAQTLFYAGLAEITRDMLEAEKEFL